MSNDHQELFAIRNPDGLWWNYHTHSFIRDVNKATALFGDEDIEKFTSEPVRCQEVCGCEVVKVGHAQGSTTELLKGEYPLRKKIAGEHKPVQHQLRCPDCGAEAIEDCGKYYVKYSCGRKHYHGRIKDIRTISCYERKERQLREVVDGLLNTPIIKDRMASPLNLIVADVIPTEVFGAALAMIMCKAGQSLDDGGGND